MTTRDRTDLPAALLARVARRMPAARAEWADALVAELAALTRPSERWQFAVECSVMALFSPEAAPLQAERRSTLVRAAAISTLLVLPLALLEARNESFTAVRGALVLYAVLWIVPVVFIVSAAPLIKAYRGGAAGAGSSIKGWLRVLLLVLLGGFWIGLVIDQMPCFLGVPNCD